MSAPLSVYAATLAMKVGTYLMTTRNLTSAESAPVRAAAREDMLVALTRYNLIREIEPTTVEDDGEDDEPTHVTLPPDADLMGLIKSAKQVAAILKDIPGQGYPAEELRWFAEQVENRVEAGDRVEAAPEGTER